MSRKLYYNVGNRPFMYRGGMSKERLDYLFKIQEERVQRCDEGAVDEFIYLKSYIEASLSDGMINMSEYNNYNNKLHKLAREFARSCKCSLK